MTDNVANVVCNLEAALRLKASCQWSYLRSHLVLALEKKRYGHRVNESCSTARLTEFFKMIGTVRWFPLLIIYILRKPEVLIFDRGDNYRAYKSKFVNRFTHGFEVLGFKALHFCKNISADIKTCDYNIIDDRVVSLLCRFVKNKHLPEKLDPRINKFIERSQLEVDALAMLRSLVAREIVLNKIFKLLSPNFVVITSYPFRSEVVAAKKNNIKVIEFQHGICDIPAYSGNAHYFPYQPDYLFCFGGWDKEKVSQFGYIENSKNIIPIGSLMIDCVYKSFKKPANHSVGSIFSVVFSCQDVVLEDTVVFVSNIARRLPSVDFKLNLRSLLEKQYILPPNVSFSYSDVLLDIASSDLHMTVFSTCAIEAGSLGRPTLFIDIRGLSTDYFYDYISLNKCAFLVSTVDQAVDFIGRGVDISASAIRIESSKYYKNDYFSNFAAALNFIKS